ncbi:MAG: serine/threonine protein kinase, partial [Planctomycetes bacterium]|nr:serine/threonine protein kinase [Planctomycetota bacterium]
MNDADLYRRAKEIFLELCDLPSAQRPDALREKCGDDERLAREVAELLDLDSASLSDGTERSLSFGANPIGREEALPETFAGFRVRARIGEGGMGVVYEAEQPSPRRTVALKVIRGDLLTARQRRRFEFEADVLGQLEHPGIARIYAAGTESGRPWFAMELVDGRHLTDDAAARRLDLRARVQLFVEVCAAVHHAHLRGVIHRDLKPANILVTSGGQPKILDFGVARSTDGDLKAVTLQTLLGQIVGTIPYMSPEQSTGDSRALDVRSDVYALGVVLFELLTGRLPYDFPERGVAEALEVVRTREAIRPSRCDPELRGDLETILLKCLEKEPDRRYSSASDLAQDLRRFLDDQPIIARPASALYQLQKFARRNRALVAGIVSIVGILTISLIAVSIALDRALEANELADVRLDEMRLARRIADAQRGDAEYARELAVDQASKSDELTQFLLYDMLGAIRPDQGWRPDLPLSSVLDIASEGAGERFADRPLVEISLRNMLGVCYANLDRGDDAIRELERALELGERELGLFHPDLLATRSNIALIAMRQGDLELARHRFRLLVPLSISQYGAEDPRTRTVLNNWATVCSRLGDEQLAYEIYQYLVSLPPDPIEKPEQRFTLRHNLANALNRLERRDEARVAYAAALEEARTEIGPLNPTTLALERGLGNTLQL